MSYFERQSGAVHEPEVESEQQQPTGESGSRLNGFRDRVSKTLQNLDRGTVQRFVFEPRELPAPIEPGEFMVPEDDVVSEVPEQHEDDRFPISALGYNRAVVDARITELEHELSQLRERYVPPISITEEIERLGEQTASILVVAHDQAHETTRLAQEQADRCIADAAANAVSMTEEAKRKLNEIDAETDVVWRERTRLLDDARTVGLALIAMAEEAVERFPPEVRAGEQTQQFDVLG